MSWVELRMARVGGWVTYMSAKIIRSVGDVGVPPFWLVTMIVGFCGGEGVLAI